MEDYTFLRQLADSWGLLVMVLIFLGVIVWVFRPGSRTMHDDAAGIPLRNEERPAPPPARDTTPAPRTGDGPAQKEEAGKR